MNRIFRQKSRFICTRMCDFAKGRKFSMDNFDDLAHEVMSAYFLPSLDMELGDSREVDEVSMELVGCLKITDIIATARYTWIGEILKKLQEAPEEDPTTKGNALPVVRVTEWLLQYCIERKLVVMGSGTYRVRCGLFGRQKKNKKCRIIFDVRPGNNKLISWGSFSLFGLDDLLRSWWMASTAWGTISVFTLDYRHQFYQYSMGEGLGRYMAMEYHGEWYRPRVMAMGFKNAPRTGQTGTWSLVLHREDEDTLGVREIDVQQQMPRFVRLWSRDESINGFIFVLLDGVLVFTRTQKLRDQWRRRILSNSKRFSAVVKEHSSDCDRVTFAGVELRRDDAKRPTVRPLRRDQVEVTATSTRRQVASCVGSIVWRLRVRRQPLLASALIDVYSKLVKPHEISNGWERCAALSENECAIVNTLGVADESYTSLQFEDWAAITDPEIRYLVTDATPTSRAGVEFCGNGKVIDVWYEACDKGAQSDREMGAVVSGVNRIACRGGNPFIILGVDADVVRFVIEKGYAKSESLRRMMLTIQVPLSRIHGVRVEGARNVADEVSRGEEIDKAKAAYSFTCLALTRGEMKER